MPDPGLGAWAEAVQPAVQIACEPSGDPGVEAQIEKTSSDAPIPEDLPNSLVAKVASRAARR